MLAFKGGEIPFLDTNGVDLATLLTKVKATVKKPYLLHPSDFVLATTQEFIGLPDNIVARLEGKSSLGRIGLMIHITAGYVDPGWQGKLTIQLKNLGVAPIRLTPNMKIAQITFMRLTSRAQRPYGAKGLGSKFQGGRRHI
jgi:dCTP deaminase